MKKILCGTFFGLLLLWSISMGCCANEANGIGLNMAAMTLERGAVAQLTATVLPGDTPDSSVSFISSSPSFVHVDQTGKVTALAPGKSTILVQSNENPNLSVRCEVLVIENQADLQAQAILGELSAVCVQDKLYQVNGTIAKAELGSADSALVIIGLYGENGKFVGCKVVENVPLKQDGSQTEIVEQIAAAAPAVKVKLIALKNLQEMTPVARAVEAQVSEQPLYHLRGFVMANSVTSLNSPNSPFSINDKDKIRFRVTDNYGKDHFLIDGSIVNEIVVSGVYDFYIGETDIDQYLGYDIELYVSEELDGYYRVQSYKINENFNHIAWIEETDKIQPVQNGTSVRYPSVIGFNAGGDMKLSWVDPAVSGQPMEYPLDYTACIIHNQKWIGSVSSLNVVPGTVTDDFAPAQGTIRMVDNNNDGKYDILFVTSYTTYVVDSVIGNKVFTKFGDLTIDVSNDVKTEIMLDAHRISLSELEEWDVISVARNVQFQGVATEILVSRNATQSILDSIDDTDPNNVIFEFNGVSRRLSTVTNKNSINLYSSYPGVTGKLYLDVFGKIAYFKPDFSCNIGFLLDVVQVPGGLTDDSYMVTVLDSESKKIEKYQLAEMVRLEVVYQDGTNITSLGRTFKAQDIVGTANSYLSIYDRQIPSLSWLVRDKILTDCSRPQENAYIYSNRILSYRCTGDKVTYISISDGSTRLTTDYYFTNNGMLDTVNYNEATGVLGNDINITDDTKVFYLPVSTNAMAQDFQVVDYQFLKDDFQYANLGVFGLDNQRNAKAILITQRVPSITVDQPISIFCYARRTHNELSEEVKIIRYYQNGIEKEVTTTAEAAQSIPELSSGDLFEYSLNKDGLLNDMGNFGENGTQSVAALKELPEYFNSSSGADYAQYIFGLPVSRSGDRIQLKAANGEGIGIHLIPQTANIYIVDLNRSVSSSLKVTADGTLGDIEPLRFDNDGAVDPDTDSAVFLKYYKGIITDVVIYKGYYSHYLQK